MPHTIVRSCYTLKMLRQFLFVIFFLSFFPNCCCQLGSRSKVNAAFGGPEKFPEFCLPTCQAVGKHFLYRLAEFSNLHSGRVTIRAIAVQPNIVFSEVLDDPLEQ